MPSIQDWSTVAAANTSVGGVNIAEGTAPPSNINNGLRNVIAHVQAFRLDTSGAVTTGGSANAQTFASNGSIVALQNGTRLSFKAGSTNTSAATLKVGSLAAIELRKIGAAGELALAAADIVAGGHYEVEYDAAADGGDGAWILLNPTPVSANAANTFAQTQTFLAGPAVALTSFGAALSLTVTDAANNGVQIVTDHASSSPLANDNALIVLVRGRDSAGNVTQYASLLGVVLDPADTSEDGEWQIGAITAGSQGTVAKFGNGVQIGAPTGGYKGAGTLNAVAVYDDNVLLTDVVETLVAEGRLDLAKWNAMVPATVIPEHRESVPVMEEAEEDRLVSTADGFELRRVPVRRQKVELRPVWDAQGRGVGVHEVPVSTVKVTPARIVKRRHTPAARLQAMVKAGFNPRDPVAYAAKLKADRALPGHITVAEWEHNKLSLGEVHNHLTLATELLASAFVGLVERNAALEARLAVLEAR